MTVTNDTPYATLMLRMLRGNTWYDHYGLVRSEQDQECMDRLVKAQVVEVRGDKFLNTIEYKRVWNY